MIRVSVTDGTSTSFRFVLNSDIDFDQADLYLTTEGEQMHVDSVTEAGSLGLYQILFINPETGVFSVNLNEVQFETIYYKDFKVVFLKDNETIDETVSFQVTPIGAEPLYGVVNKLRFDFEKLATLSGVQIRVFLPNLLSQKCPDCWDEELGQAISSSCNSCGGDSVLEKYRPLDIIARKIKTQAKQQYDTAGIDERESVIFNTYARADFIKGIIVADLTSKQFYEIAERTVANIGGIRTSTTLVVALIKSSDSRVKKLIPLLY